jgi:hypothetical protein
VSNVFQIVPHAENGGSGDPSTWQHQVEVGAGCHSHLGQRIRSDDFPSSSFGMVKIFWSHCGSGRLNSSNMVVVPL